MRFLLPTGRSFAAVALAILAPYACAETGASTPPAEPHPQTVSDAGQPAIDASDHPSLRDGGDGPRDAAADLARAPADAAPQGSDAGVVADAPHPSVPIPGRCVDVVADVKARAKLPKDAPLTFEPVRVDLDGDGNDDWIITTDADARDYSGKVYIARNACGIPVLDWRGSAPSPVTTQTRGFLDLEVSGSPCKVGCCPAESITTYTWNGRTYQRARTRTETHSCSGPFSVPRTP